MSGPVVLDVEEVIDRSGVGAMQRRVLLLCCGVLILDGIDTTMAGYLGQALMTDWGISTAALGPVVTSGLVGLALGSLIAGPLGDRFGRKKVILASLVFFGLASAASALATGVFSFSVLRVLTGLGLGASMPNAATLVAEYAPKARRAVMMTFIYCGFTLGAAVGGYLTAYLIAAVTWHWALVAGGILPLLFAAAVAAGMPESPKFLARHGGRDAELAAIVTRIEPAAVTPATRFTVAEDKAATRAPVRALLTSRYRLGTIAVWAGFVAAFFTVYLMNSWLPILMSDVGFSLAQVATIGFLLQVGGTVGNVAIGYLMDRFGLHRTMIVGTGCAGVMIIAIAVSPQSVVVIGALIFVLGMFTNSIATGFPVLAAHFYPTAMRATGTSWATGIARGGAIGGAAIGTLLVSLGPGYQAVFLTLLVPVAVGVIAVAVKSRTSNADGTARGAGEQTAASHPSMGNV